VIDVVARSRACCVVWLAVSSAMSGCASSQATTSAWQVLFDGSDLSQWTGLGRPDFPTDSWQIAGDTLHKVASSEKTYGGDLRTKERFKNFELCFEFKLTQGANSGVKYNVSEEMSAQEGHPSAAIGFEFQVLDDRYHPDAKQGRDRNRTVGALYDIYPPAVNKPVVAAGDWHEGCVWAETDQIRHTLDGETVLAYRLSDPDFVSKVAASKFASIDGFALRREGFIVLQDHFDELWYRNIRVRRLDSWGK